MVKQTKSQFAHFGIPETVLTDNGFEFRADRSQAECVTTSLYHSQENGIAASAVKIAKRLIKRGHQDNATHYLELEPAELR